MRRHDTVGTHPEEWQGSVISNLSHADNTHSDAVTNIAGSILTIRRTNAEHSKMRDTVHSHFAQKIKNTQELRQQLASRIHACKQALEHTEWRLKKCQAASDALVEPTELCRQRLALRQKRPKRELVFDGFQQALLSEEKALHAAKAKYADCCDDMLTLRQELASMISHLEADFRDKDHALNIDNTCVQKKYRDTIAKLDKSYARHNMGQIPVFPEIASTPRDPITASSETEGRAQERARQKQTLRTIEEALRLEANAKQRWHVASEAVDAMWKAGQAAARQTQEAMARKIEHTELLKQELVKQRKMTEQRWADVQKCLGLTMEKLMFIEKPIGANEHRSEIRSRRVPREATNDEVSEALLTQQHTLQAKKAELQTKVATMQQSAQELQHTIAQLEEDIRDKDKALTIDRSCASCKNSAHGHKSFGFAKVGQGQRHFAGTASSTMRQVPS